MKDYCMFLVDLSLQCFFYVLVYFCDILKNKRSKMKRSAFERGSQESEICILCKWGLCLRTQGTALLTMREQIGSSETNMGLGEVGSGISSDLMTIVSKRDP